MMAGKAANYERYKKYRADLKRWTSKTPVKTSLAVALSLFLVAGFLGFALRPAITEIVELNAKIESDEEMLGKLESKSAALIRASSIWRRMEPFMDFVQVSIPVAPEYMMFVKELEVLAIRNNLIYLSADLDPSLVYSEAYAPYEPRADLEDIELHFSVRVEGDYSNMVSYLEDVRKMDRVIDITGITMSSEATKEKLAGEAITMNLDGIVYYFADLDMLSTILGVQQ